MRADLWVHYFREHPPWNGDWPAVNSKLIDVTQSRLPNQSSKSGPEYARLFAQHFRSVTPIADLQSEPDETTPPSTGSSAAAQAEAAWLANILKDEERDVTEWRIPEDCPPLTIMFDEILRQETVQGGEKPSGLWGHVFDLMHCGL